VFWKPSQYFGQSPNTNAKEKLTDKAFEVVYYPRSNWNDFVVDIKVVDEAIKINWYSGMGVELSLETKESSKMTCFWPQRTISIFFFGQVA